MDRAPNTASTASFLEALRDKVMWGKKQVSLKIEPIGRAIDLGQIVFLKSSSLNARATRQAEVSIEGLSHGSSDA